VTSPTPFLVGRDDSPTLLPGALAAFFARAARRDPTYERGASPVLDAALASLDESARLWRETHCAVSLPPEPEIGAEMGGSDGSLPRMTTAEAADVLDLTPRRVRQLREAGVLEGVLEGRRGYTFDAAEVALLASTSGVV
jgi:hypothetical protein